MAKGKGGGRIDPPNFNMMGNPARKADNAKGIIAEGKNPGIENPLDRKEKKLDLENIKSANKPKEQRSPQMESFRQKIEERKQELANKSHDKDKAAQNKEADKSKDEFEKEID